MKKVKHSGYLGVEMHEGFIGGKDHDERQDDLAGGAQLVIDGEGEGVQQDDEVVDGCFHEVASLLHIDYILERFIVG